MYTKAMILPLDIEGELYCLQDEKGKTIGTGTREVCEVLLSIITKPSTPSHSFRSFYVGSRSGRTTILARQNPYVRVRS